MKENFLKNVFVKYPAQNFQSSYTYVLFFYLKEIYNYYLIVDFYENL